MVSSDNANRRSASGGFVPLTPDQGLYHVPSNSGLASASGCVTSLQCFRVRSATSVRRDLPFLGVLSAFLDI